MTRLALAAFAACLTACTSQAREPIIYNVDGGAFEGYLAEAGEGGEKGLVVLIHDWDGLTDYERTRADMLAEAGYDAFAIDLYGEGNRPDTTEGKKAEVGKLYGNRELMRARLLAGLERARALTSQDDAVVMGYCFGGGAVLELARSGAASGIAGYATFHGSLDTPDDQDYSAVNAPILVMHGGADAGIPNALAAELATRLEEAGKDYRVEIYAGAPHAWTVFGSDRYRQGADAESWDAFLDFAETRLAAAE